MKTLEFIFQDTQIHFALQNDGEVMVNATEMAKAFGKKVDNFIRLKSTDEFIKCLKSELLKTEFAPSDVREQTCRNQILQATNKATYMHEVLALKFAAWLDVNFEVWVYKKIQSVIFGNYKKHWDAHAQQEAAKLAMENLKSELITSATPELAVAYFEQERIYKQAKNEKTKAIRNQLSLFKK